MASWMRRRVSPDTLSGADSARDTVTWETPASRPISAMVTPPRRRAGPVSFKRLVKALTPESPRRPRPAGSLHGAVLPGHENGNQDRARDQHPQYHGDPAL